MTYFERTDKIWETQVLRTQKMDESSTYLTTLDPR